MHKVSTLAITLALTGLVGALGPGCGGSDTQPEMPDPSVVDRSADDLDLPEEEGSSGDEDSDVDEGGEAASASHAPVRVVSAERTPIEGAPPRLRITAPRDGQRIAQGAVQLRVDLRGWELQPDPGQHVHVIVDDNPYIAIRDVSGPLDLGALMREHLSVELTEGTHVVRVFPSRGHHESVKQPGAFATVTFHYRRPTPGFEFDASAPLLTYSRPKGCNPAGRLLLDFYVSNVELAADGHRVRYSFGGIEGFVTQWTPHYIENLPVGEHQIQLQLVDGDGALVPGRFNDSTHTIRIADSC